MKIVMIHGQNHAGSTCMMARELTRCPHYQKLEPLVTAILEAELLILNSPVYVYHATGQMMSFLDHFGTWWVVHRPLPEMANKQAVVIVTAAGGGMKNAARDMADSLEMWGVCKVYRLGFGVQAAKPDEIPARIMERIHRETEPGRREDSEKRRKKRIQWSGEKVVLPDALCP
ncbi:MAG: NAD(P)H-dependent oxidoreductase [Lachnospiraceae bacterium]|nr:NAD(P)H-dependent oxidoreductase [Lachnospiraceae bacterium]